MSDLHQKFSELRKFLQISKISAHFLHIFENPDFDPQFGQIYLRTTQKWPLLTPLFPEIFGKFSGNFPDFGVLTPDFDPPFPQIPLRTTQKHPRLTTLFRTFSGSFSDIFRISGFTNPEKGPQIPPFSVTNLHLFFVVLLWRRGILYTFLTRFLGFTGSFLGWGGGVPPRWMYSNVCLRLYRENILTCDRTGSRVSKVSLRVL